MVIGRITYANMLVGQVGQSRLVTTSKLLMLVGFNKVVGRKLAENTKRSRGEKILSTPFIVNPNVYILHFK